MTAQILAAELGNLIQDSKRKNTELRNAAEKSLQDLKALPTTSEAQLTTDLSRRPHFISPFLIACGTHNAKFASTAVSCLQRLSVARALPRERLPEVLEALKESVSLSHDVQLRILQALPSLLQNYTAEIRGDLLSTTLHICSTLQNAKNFAVSNTAAATLQQLVISVFDRVASEDDKALEIPSVTEVPSDDGPIAIRAAAHDAYKVFNDLNLLVTGEKPTFIRFSTIPSTSTLELIEAVLSNHGNIMSTHAEQIHILRSLLMPTIIRSLSDRLSFPITLRIIRILNLLIRNHLRIMPSECEIALGLLNHMLDPEASPLWKRALCLEVFRGIYSDSRLLLEIYSQFDKQEGKKRIFGDNLASFVRLATEKPAVIGLGQYSSVPASRFDSKDTSEQAVAEAGALAGVIGGHVAETNSAGPPVGIGTHWSSLKTPCIEHLDKSEPPALPETYIYSLVLTCITNVSESLAKFILPMTVHHESKTRKKSRVEDATKSEAEPDSPRKDSRPFTRTQSFRKKTIPVNPLTLEEHSAFDYIKTTSMLVTECWPAVLATSSTFLNAALDSDYYRALVRAIQKFTQVAGLLRLSTPRDAFLTSLAKAAVPPSLLLANVSSPRIGSSENTGVFSNAKGLLGVDSLVSQASSMSEKNRRPSHETGVALGPRNLLCLRALLNLAIALGPTLQSAWTIIFETLQVADLVMAMASHQTSQRATGGSGFRPELESSSEKMEAETSAVQSAARRLFESTVDFPNDSFVEVLTALCALLNNDAAPESGQRTPTTSRSQILHQRRMGSVSGISLSTESTSRDSAFVLNKIGELAGLNEGRLAQYDPIESGWDVLIAELVRFSANDHKATSTRLLAADILSRSAREIAELSTASGERNEIQTRILSALQTQIAALYHDKGDSEERFSDTNIKIHQVALEALKDVIEKCGDSLVAGWDSVFDSLLSVFVPIDPALETDREGDSVHKGHVYLKSIKVISRLLARSAFGTLQLVCSDFLSAVPETSLSTLLELLSRFCRQQEDLNMSLTAITFFWNVSDYLQARSDLSQLPSLLSSGVRQDEIRHTVQAHSRKGTTPALWLQVLLDLSALTTDRRAELRNSAVQTIQRIFENYVEQLSSDAWMLCLRTVLFGLVESNLAIQESLKDTPQTTQDENDAWNETTKAVLDSVSILISMYIGKVEGAVGLGQAWSDLLEYFQKYFNCGSHALGRSVFTTISGVLSRVEDPRFIGSAPLLKTAAVWKDYFNHRDDWEGRREGNQEAFIAYAQAFKSIYRLSQDSLGSRLPAMLANLEACIVDSDEIAYSSDVDHMTPLQTQVMECLSVVKSETSDLPPFLVQMLSRLSILPYTSTAESPERRGPTFVALSKASMVLLESVTIKHIKDEDIYTSGAFVSALKSLAIPIHEKYVWQREGKLPTIWQKATTTSLAILEPGLTRIKGQGGKIEAAIWTQVIHIASGIIRAQVSSNISIAQVEKDETFDMESFAKLRNMTTLDLGSPVVPDILRRTYTRALFETSLIHQPAPGDIPNLSAAPLEDLYKVRLGHTNNAQPTPRTEMAYACLAELLSLVSIHDGSTERIKLAQAAAPYLILRTALPVRTYIADHPLRGRMPVPETQRRELLFVLTELRKLESEPHAIPDAPGVTSLHKKHLHRLYPLLVQATKVARNDAEVFECLLKLTDMVGNEFGLLDDE
ncbi:hypothetical protein BDV95DRAFT_195911 [Massariosphaeria phaeospora]|uniref:Endosomal peripheral membrane protein-like protein n=1 Tax=Massariosphaeria phaeospora TaxID=100035 RepID=A0A7C8HZW0_9PLEO|nr:hypothetical protein BDV95DRAFT_195911 [Massariosphaeria phaeospora]